MMMNNQEVQVEILGERFEMKKTRIRTHCFCCGEFGRICDFTFNQSEKKYYCEDCLEEKCKECDNCGDYYNKDWLVVTYEKDDKKYNLCEECNDNNTVCTKCGDLYGNKEIYTNGETALCHECCTMSERYFVCDECEGLFSYDSDHIANWEQIYCSSCAEKLGVTEEVKNDDE